MDEFHELEAFIAKLPAIKPGIGKGRMDNGLWWVKFQLDIEHELAWQVIQEIAFVANYISVEERLPAVFYPVSPPPYLNGGPKNHLSWVMESQDKDFTPGDLAGWLKERLPNPVDDPAQWKSDEDE